MRLRAIFRRAYWQSRLSWRLGTLNGVDGPGQAPLGKGKTAALGDIQELQTMCRISWEQLNWKALIADRLSLTLDECNQLIQVRVSKRQSELRCAFFKEWISIWVR